MYRRIVVALDPDGRALCALPIAIALARPSHAEVRIIHVLEGSGIRLPHELDRIVTEAGEAGVRADVEMVAGGEASVAEVLADVVDADRADLLVLGSHGRSGLGCALRGSVGMRLAAGLDLPLLVVCDRRAGAGRTIDQPIRRVLVAVGRSPQSDWAVTSARDLARDHGSAVMAAHVRQVMPIPVRPGVLTPTEDDETQAQCEALLARARAVLATAGTAVLTRSLPGSESIVAEVGATADQWRADIVVVGHRRLTPIGRLLSGSVTWGLVRKTGTPILLAARPTAPDPAVSPRRSPVRTA